MRYDQMLRERLYLADSYNRLPILFECQRWNATWFRALGREWENCDNIGHHHFALSHAFIEGPEFWRSMMTKQELARFDALPEIVDAYRGCGPLNRFGLSWSLDRSIAAKFPTLNRYHQDEPLLLTAKIPKTQIVAVKLGRNEEEIIALLESWDIVREEQL